MNIIIALIAVIIERLIAYPNFLQSRFGHPVEWIGKYIVWFEHRYNQGSGKKRLIAGFIMLFSLLILCAIISFALIYLLGFLPFSFIFEAIIAFIFLSFSQLGQMVNNVAKGLNISLDEGRRAVSHIVGRDVSNLDEAEISRAAIESLAENFSDGYVAPLFYLIIFGLPGIIIYKAINTADSMVGHKNEKFKDFGFFSAKLDDLANYIPARISAIIFILSAVIFQKGDWKKSLTAALRDAKNHVSPNAGWPEASLAGALGFALGGKRSYAGKELDLAQMGDGKRNIGKEHIKLSLKFYNLAGNLILLSILASAIILLLAKL